MLHLAIGYSSFTKKQALQRFIAASGDAVHPGSPLENQSLLVRWHQALHYFKHPAAPLPASFKLNRLATTTTSESLIGGPNRQIRQEEQAFFTARWHTWQETFRDVYMSFRRQGGTNAIDSTQHEDSFYLRSNEFTVCFHLNDNDGRRDSILSLGRQHNQKSETPGEPEGDPMQAKPGRYRRLCAVMTQSTARMRKALHRLNVAYSMPYATATRTQREAGEFHLLEEELKAFEADRSRNKANDSSDVPAVTRSVPPVEHVHGTDSLLLFHGHLAVHGLYEFLINRTPMSSQDVPELYALHPFGNATIQTLQATSFGRVGGPAVASPPSDTMENPQARATQFRTEISGFCFPSSVATLLDVLKHVWTTKQETVDQTNRSLTGGRELEVALRAFMEAVPATERLNAIRLDEQLARATGGSGDLQERGKRKQELELSKRRVETVILRQMELPASHYDVETTTRPTVARR
ncbi:hypothetical protein BBJ28_00002176 [Nothophytophthora sp. Chile5]|nr:hypothetical protein BBJ28_00002176 [Nothophytophthora sp. Chile5]